MVQRITKRQRSLLSKVKTKAEVRKAWRRWMHPSDVFGSCAGRGLFFRTKGTHFVFSCLFWCGNSIRDFNNSPNFPCWRPTAISNRPSPSKDGMVVVCSAIGVFQRCVHYCRPKKCPYGVRKLLLTSLRDHLTWGLGVIGRCRRRYLPMPSVIKSASPPALRRARTSNRHVLPWLTLVSDERNNYSPTRTHVLHDKSKP